MKKIVKRFLEIIKVIGHFFPLHLLASHFKFNIVGLIYWLFLFLVVTNNLGSNFGVPFLFLSPEYHGVTSPTAFLLLGLSVGGFIMGFHAYSYIRLGSKYPFIATIFRPFFKFCINNSLLPLLFIITMVIEIYKFQINQEYVEPLQAMSFIFAFVGGVFLFISLSFLYFFPTNKDITRLTGKSLEEIDEKFNNIKSSIHKKEDWTSKYLGASDENKYHYIGNQMKIRLSRSVSHYDARLLNSVLSQNHTNAAYFEIALVISFFIIGFFKDFQVFQVPASVSIMMLFTIIIMIISAIFSWLKYWTYPVLIGLIVLINYMSLTTSVFDFKSYAFGLSYNQEDLIPFSPETVRESGLQAQDQEIDYLNFLQTLDNWKEKQNSKKPKLVIINTSGGGLRSALWTFSVMQHLDSITNNQFVNQVQMITGASGGMIGAAYYRELLIKFQEEKISSTYGAKYRDNIGKDLLNRIAFSIATNDIFFRFQKIRVDGKTYIKDRGHAFEQELKSNLDNVFDTELGDYTKLERDASIPTMIFTPTIINDGRRLLIGSQHLSFLQQRPVQTSAIGLEAELENVEYLKYFKDVNPEKIKFTSVLRMNATFPYIMPMVTLPTDPGMQIMDAGIRDNYGTKITVEYLLALRDWIEQNTSGVVIVKIRDTKKALLAETYEPIGVIRKFFLPAGNLYGNFPRVQDFDQDALLATAWKALNIKLDVVTFNLRERFEDKISLSWHLTKNEKNKIISSIYNPSNVNQTERLKKLLE